MEAVTVGQNQSHTLHQLHPMMGGAVANPHESWIWVVPVAMKPVGESMICGADDP